MNIYLQLGNSIHNSLIDPETFTNNPLAIISGNPIGDELCLVCALFAFESVPTILPSDCTRSPTFARLVRTGGGGGSGTSIGIPRRFLFSCMIEIPVETMGDIWRVNACRMRSEEGCMEDEGGWGG